MPTPPSLISSRRGEFRRLYQQLRRDRSTFQTTPIIFCEGDSWFDTPLAMNLLDWLVWPAPQTERKGAPLFGNGGLFFRTEASGALALEMFSAAGVRDKAAWFGRFDFDLVLLSAGGNDFVGPFLAELFADAPPMTVASAYQRVRDSGRYAQVLASYQRLLAALQRIRPDITILAHSYDYPQLPGMPARPTLHDLGLAALFTRQAGPWIAPALATALPAAADQRAFARRLIDGFVTHVLTPLRDGPSTGNVFDFVDLRGSLPRPDLWADEMHPTSAGFALLADKFRQRIQTGLKDIQRLPKRPLQMSERSQ